MKVIRMAPRADARKRVQRPGSRGGHIYGYTSKGDPIYTLQGARKQQAEQRWKTLLASKTPADRMAFEETRKRGLRIPPAWTGVWVNPDSKADLQVKGKDAKGRTQYLYSVSARNRADAKKFNRLKAFNAALPKIQSAVSRDLDSSHEAQVLYLISKTGFRIGGSSDTKADKTAYGASTLTSDHVRVEGDRVHFDFTGKKGVQQKHTVEDAKLARMLKNRSGKLFDTNDAKVRSYLKSVGGREFKVKDFRTHFATTEALRAVKPPPPKTDKELAGRILEVARRVAAKLGNTPQMARDSYIDPAVFSQWRQAVQT